MFKIKRDDEVIVLAGKDKGKRGKVRRVLDNNKLVVSGINMVKKHTKPSARGAGGIESREAPIQVSNVAHIDPSDGKPTRIGFKFLDDGRKVRFAKRSGEIIDR